MQQCQHLDRVQICSAMRDDALFRPTRYPTAEKMRSKNDKVNLLPSSAVLFSRKHDPKGRPVTALSIRRVLIPSMQGHQCCGFCRLWIIGHYQDLHSSDTQLYHRTGNHTSRSIGKWLKLNEGAVHDFMLKKTEGNEFVEQCEIGHKGSGLVEQGTESKWN